MVILSYFIMVTHKKPCLIVISKHWLLSWLMFEEGAVRKLGMKAEIVSQLRVCWAAFRYFLVHVREISEQWTAGQWSSATFISVPHEKMSTCPDFTICFTIFLYIYCKCFYLNCWTVLFYTSRCGIQSVLTHTWIHWPFLIQRNIGGQQCLCAVKPWETDSCTPAKDQMAAGFVK